MDYTAGFMFDRNLKEVALVRKLRPKWQAGKLNAIGGKLEQDEEIFDCMVREFEEETGFLTTRDQWKHFAVMTGHDAGSFFQVHFFVTLGDLSKLKTVEEEEILIVKVEDIFPLREDVVENLPWLVALAIDHIQDGRPKFTNIHY